MLHNTHLSNYYYNTSILGSIIIASLFLTNLGLYIETYKKSYIVSVKKNLINTHIYYNFVQFKTIFQEMLLLQHFMKDIDISITFK